MLGIVIPKKDDGVAHLTHCRYGKLYARIHKATPKERADFVRRLVPDADTQTEVLERWKRINNAQCEWLEEEDIMRAVQSFAKPKGDACYFINSCMLESVVRRPSRNETFLDCMSRIPLVCTVINTQPRTMHARSGTHWVVLACDQRAAPPEIMVFDSLVTPNINTGHFEECVRRYGMRSGITSFRVRVMASPKQLNQIDCGRFACAVVCALMRGVPPNEMITASGIRQRSMPTLARFMADSVLCADIVGNVNK